MKVKIMKPTDFSKYLTEFLSNYLPIQKNANINTIHSYRDTFKVLIKYCAEEKNIFPEKITLSKLDKNLIVDFLNWLETVKNNSVSTRNQRLAAIHSFFRYVQAEDPTHIFHFQKVILIPTKKTIKAIVNYLSPDAMQVLLAQPDKTTKNGRRDLTLLCTLYDTGARVQELIDLKVSDIILEAHPIVILTGKGNKVRRVPLMKNTKMLLEKYIQENSLDYSWKVDYPLFYNKQRSKLTREGIAYIISKYIPSARAKSNQIPQKIRPHLFRHSKAMHLLQAGVNLIYIRDFLGHVDLKTTEIYARHDTEAKRKAIEKAYPDLITNTLPDWRGENSKTRGAKIKLYSQDQKVTLNKIDFYSEMYIII